MELTVVSRGSRLAVVQAEEIMAALAVRGVPCRLLTVKTTGDRILDRPLDQIGGKGLFVRELDEALRTGRGDVSVHSCKDLPMELPEDLPVAAYSRREDPRDALVLPAGRRTLDRGRPIGCGSARRRLQLRALFPGVEVRDVRGNVTTRLEKLDRGEFGALVLAAAGLRRLGLAERITRCFSIDEMLPAAGQGILALQCRPGVDPAVLSPVHDPAAAACAAAERAFVRALGGGCSSPVAAHATLEGDVLCLRGLYADGAERLYRGAVEGPPERGEALAAALAGRLKEEAAWREK